ncbi:MAG: hypothetical protein MI919_32290 [Holophagales bacterium]|nr:hypothetical protein [Holophagales bacterium]
MRKQSSRLAALLSILSLVGAATAAVGDPDGLQGMDAVAGQSADSGVDSGEQSSEEPFAQGLMGAEVVEDGQIFALSDQMVLEYDWDPQNHEIKLSVPKVPRWPFPPHDVGTVQTYDQVPAIYWLGTRDHQLTPIADKAPFADFKGEPFGGWWTFSLNGFDLTEPHSDGPSTYYIFQIGEDFLWQVIAGVIQPVSVDADGYLTLRWWLGTQPVDGFTDLPDPPLPTEADPD